MCVPALFTSDRSHRLACCDVLQTGNKFILTCERAEVSREEGRIEVHETVGFTPTYFVV